MKIVKMADPEFCQKLYDLLGIDADGVRMISRIRVTVEPYKAIIVEETSNIDDSLRPQ